MLQYTGCMPKTPLLKCTILNPNIDYTLRCKISPAILNTWNSLYVFKMVFVICNEKEHKFYTSIEIGIITVNKSINKIVILDIKGTISDIHDFYFRHNFNF